MATKITTPELFNLSNNNTAATQLPVFTTSTRPTSGSSGEMIFNSTTEKVEYWDGFQWNMIKDEAVAPPLEPNQILWLDANNTSSWTGSGTTWYDVSGNGYNATITTTVPSTGTVNGATYLNLSTRADYFKIPYSVHGGALNATSANVVTYIIWMRLVGKTSEWGIKYSSGEQVMSYQKS